MSELFESNESAWKLIARGKVRDIYEFGTNEMLIVTSDRLSAFDVILPTPIPDKGIVLTQISNFWFEKTAALIPNHLLDPDPFSTDSAHTHLAGRAVVVRTAKSLPVEAIVRGYLAGSGWKEYQQSGTVCGIQLPAGLQESSKLPEAMYTPSTKAEVGGKDENISFAAAADLVGEALAAKLRDVSLELYERGAEWARERGIIIADTKFELGLVEGELLLCDEVLTPDSSRFWPTAAWEPGTTPPSFDKQPVRDYLDGLDWDKTPPPPPLPDEVVSATSERYIEAYERITGRSFADWPGVDG